MINDGKKNILGVLVDAVDYEATADAVMEAANAGRGLTVSALAVHGLMTGVLDAEQKYRLNHFDLLVPDGQPLRWAMNLLYRTGLRDRVYGPNLMGEVSRRAESEGLSVYFYGSTERVLASLRVKMEDRFPGLLIAGIQASKFRRLSREERDDLVTHIRASGARIVFVGLGCPRQEVWAFELRQALSVPILAVGAAFPLLAGEVHQAPEWMQRRGLEWLFRLSTEPRRLWRRYLLLNLCYMVLMALQASRLVRFTAESRKPGAELRYG